MNNQQNNSSSIREYLHNDGVTINVTIPLRTSITDAIVNIDAAIATLNAARDRVCKNGLEL